MRFLSKSNLLKNDSALLVANIYSDKISVFVVARKNNGNAASILASAVEPQEGDIKQGNEPDVDKILLNLNKALQALPLEIIRLAKSAVFGFGADISDFKFSQLKLERQDKEKKISKEESDSLAKSLQNAELFIERFAIDGFVVQNPVGLNGKELVLDAVSISFNEKLIAEIESLSTGRGLGMSGFINLTQSALGELKNPEHSSVGKSFIFVSIFQNNTDVVVVRDNVINSIGNLGAGYGIIEKSVSEKFGVGVQEAKDIIRKMRSGTLNGESDDSAKSAAQYALAAYIEKLRGLFGNIDKMLLLPGSIIIGASEESPELLKTLLDKIWLADLPLERNIELNSLDAMTSLEEFRRQVNGSEKLNSAFDLAALKFIIQSN